MKRLLALVIILAVISAPLTSAVDIDSNVSVEINPNAELLGIVYYLAFGKDPFVIDRGAYLSEVENHFGTFRDSKAVELLKSYFDPSWSIPRRDYALLVLEYYLLLCSEPPELEPLAPIDDSWFKNQFLPALREFAEESDFMDFYRSHMSYYKEDLDIYENALRSLPPDEFMREHAGVRGIKYEFLHPYLVAVHGHSFSPVLNGTEVWGAGGMLPLVRRTPQRTLWSYKTARDTMFGLPLNRDYVRSEKLNELLYLGFIYHELGHDVTIPAINAYQNLSNLTYFVDVIRNDMPYLAKYDIHFWSRAGMLYEGFADAWEDFALSHLNENYTLLELNMQKAWGEFWVGWLLNRTRYYSQLSEKTGKPFSDYVSSILDEMKGFASPKNASLAYSKEVPVTPLRALDKGAHYGRVVVVYGTANPDPGGTERDRETAEAIAENLRKFYSQWGSVEVLVKADVNVTGSDLSSVLVLIGGPVANRIVDKLDEDFPLRFEKVNGRWGLVHTRNVTSFVILDENSPLKKVYGNVSIALGKLGNVANAGVLMAIRNPYNESNYIVWVAGENRNLTALFENPTYYLSSYEIWSKEGIELGFYVQPLASP